MGTKLKYLILICSFILYSCHYHSDKLKVKNNTQESIGYETLAKNQKGIYYQVSAGGEIKAHKSDSPPTRGSIEYNVFKEHKDDFLYIVFYNLKFRDYVYKNINKIATDNRFCVKKYSESELDKSNWIVEYNGY